MQYPLRTALACALALVCLPCLAQNAPAPAPADSYARGPLMGHLLHWARFPLKVAFVSTEDTAPVSPDFKAAVLAGFSDWVGASRGVIRCTVVDNPTQADLCVRFDPQASVPGQGAAVGYTSMTFAGQTLRHAAMELAIGDTNPSDLRTVAAHEFGHALGIDGHSPDADDLMYSTTTRILGADGVPVAQPVHPVTARDLHTLEACYPALLGSLLAQREPSAGARVPLSLSGAAAHRRTRAARASIAH